MTDLFHWTDRKTLVRPFFLSPDGDLTYGDLLRLVGRWRGFIRSRQYAKPTRVALAMADPLHTIAATLALWCEGHIVCPLHLHWSGEARAHLLETLGVNVCIAEPPEPDSMNDVAEPPEIGLSQHALAMLLYTSGSCAAPKGCCLTLAALLGNASASLRNMPLGIGDVWLLSLPLFHVGGWGLVLRTLLSGSALALPARNAPIPAGVTHVSCVPTQLARWFKQVSICPVSRPSWWGARPFPGYWWSARCIEIYRFSLPTAAPKWPPKSAPLARMSAMTSNHYRPPVMCSRGIRYTSPKHARFSCAVRVLRWAIGKMARSSTFAMPRVGIEVAISGTSTRRGDSVFSGARTTSSSLAARTYNRKEWKALYWNRASCRAAW
uniref:AMP-binding enzyme n=1 Tax=Candidatus Kentrum sp. LPFa TaxID=2126335 RepID=A0A450W7Z7_9GAMM|nr:MAG: AMP-binding enzyme [Candidatus Kentron sp. LPFa]